MRFGGGFFVFVVFCLVWFWFFVWFLKFFLNLSVELSRTAISEMLILLQG